MESCDFEEFTLVSEDSFRADVAASTSASSAGSPPILHRSPFQETSHAASLSSLGGAFDGIRTPFATPPRSSVSRSLESTPAGFYNDDTRQKSAVVDFNVLVKNLRDVRRNNARTSSSDNIHLIVGPSGSGKTTTILYLLGHKMRTRRIKETTQLPDGTFTDGERDVIEVDQSYVPPGISTSGNLNSDLRISHEKNAQTRYITCVEAAGLFVYDSAGVCDTEGPNMDIPNAASIEMTVRSAGSVSFIVLLDFGSITGGRSQGVAMALRPISRLIPNLSTHLASFAFLFSNVPTNISAKKLMGELTALLRNKEVAADPTFNAFVHASISFLQKHGEDVIVRPAEVPNTRICEILHDITPFVPCGQVRLPLSDECITALREACGSVRISLDRSLHAHDYRLALSYLEDMTTVAEEVPIPDAKRTYASCIEAVEKAIRLLTDAAVRQYDSKAYKDLSATLTLLETTRCLKDHVDPTIYQPLNKVLKALDNKTKEVHDTFTGKRAFATDDACKLDDLRNIVAALSQHVDASLYNSSVAAAEALCLRQSQSVGSVLSVTREYSLSSLDDAHCPAAYVTVQPIFAAIASLRLAMLLQDHIPMVGDFYLGAASDLSKLVRDIVERMRAAIAAALAPESYSLGDCAAVVRLMPVLTDFFAVSEINSIVDGELRFADSELLEALLASSRSALGFLEKQLLDMRLSEMVPALGSLLAMAKCHEKYDSHVLTQVREKLRNIKDQLDRVSQSSSSVLERLASCDESDFRNVATWARQLESGAALQHLLVLIFPSIDIPRDSERIRKALRQHWASTVTKFQTAIEAGHLAEQAVASLRDLDCMSPLALVCMDMASCCSQCVQRMTSALLDIRATHKKMTLDVPSCQDLFTRVAEAKSLIEEGVQSTAILATQGALVNQPEWCAQALAELTNICRELRGQVSPIIEGLRERAIALLIDMKPEEAHQQLSALQEWAKLDDLLERQPSSGYHHATASMSTHLSTVVESTLTAINRNELDSANTNKEFLKRCFVLAKHIPDRDFTEWNRGITVAYREKTDDLSGEISGFLKGSQYEKIAALLAVIKQSGDPVDRRQFEKYDLIITETLSDIHSSSLEMSTEEPSRELILRIANGAKLAKRALALETIITYDVRKNTTMFLNQMERVFEEASKGFVGTMNMLNFVNAEAFMKLLRQTSQVDGLFRELIPGTWTSFGDRVRSLEETRILNLQDTLTGRAEASLGSAVLAREVNSKPVNIRDINTIFERCRDAADKGCFPTEVNFNAICGDIEFRCSMRLQDLIVAVKEAIFKGTFEAASTGIARLQAFQACKAVTDIQSLRLDVEKLRESQRRAEESSILSWGWNKLEMVERATDHLENIRKDDHKRYEDALNSIQAKASEDCEVCIKDHVPTLPHVQASFDAIETFVCGTMAFIHRMPKNPQTERIGQSINGLVQSILITLRSSVQTVQSLLSTGDASTADDVLIQIKTGLVTLKCLENTPPFINLRLQVDKLCEQSATTKYDTTSKMQTVDQWNVTDSSQPEKHISAIRELEKKAQSNRKLKPDFDKRIERLEAQIRGLPSTATRMWEMRKFEDVYVVMRNINELAMNCPDILQGALLTRQRIFDFLMGEFESLRGAMLTHFEHRQFKELNKKFEEAAMMDTHFHRKLPSIFTNSLCGTIKKSIVDATRKIMSERAPQLSGPAQYAQLIVDLKEYVKHISAKDIEVVVNDMIKQLILECAQKGIKATVLGNHLMSSGALGREVAQDHPQFRAQIGMEINRMSASITPEHAMRIVVEKNPDVDAGVLSDALSQYNSTFSRILKEYLVEKMGTGELKDLVKEAKAMCSELHERKDYGTIKAKLPDVLAYVFAVWSIDSSSDMFAETGDKDSIIQPNAVQILTILRLLGIDRVKEGSAIPFLSLITSMLSKERLNGHLAEVLTGNGKSILLGGLSAVLALLGFDVYTVCYSKNLSQRDFKAFERLFGIFGLEDSVHYSTLRQLAETVINEDGDVRELTGLVVQGKPLPKGVPRDDRKQRVLLIDEVDVFMQKDFYGTNLCPIFTFNTADTVELFRYVWDNKAKNLKVQDVQRHAAYARIKKALSPIVVDCLDTQVKSMVDHVHSFGNPAYVVHEGKIGYKSLDTINVKSVHGKKTAFAYLYELEKGNVTKEVAEENLTFTFACGSYSFAEIPKLFTCILGVTGTLESVPAEGQSIIRDVYGIKSVTYMPSIYGTSDFKFFPKNDVTLAQNRDDWHRDIVKNVIDNTNAKRPVLVFFESEEHLSTFQSSPYGAKLGDVNVVTEKTTNLEHFVRRATESGTVTLFVRVFGRGLDFQTRDDATNVAGGVHVVQTFFSTELCEEIQIKGRTARQGKQGSYKLILNLPDVAAALSEGGVKQEELLEWRKGEDFYDKLCQARTALEDKRVKDLRERADKAKSRHESTMTFRRDLLTGKLTKETFLSIQSL